MRVRESQALFERPLPSDSMTGSEHVGPRLRVDLRPSRRLNSAQ